MLSKDSLIGYVTLLYHIRGLYAIKEYEDGISVRMAGV